MSNTGIRIETIQEVSDNGEKGYRVTKINALTKKELPELYLKGSAVYLTNDGDLYHTRASFIWTELNKFYPVSEMEERLAYIRKAGQHLADVNRELAEKRADWNSPVTFVDGVEVPVTFPKTNCSVGQIKITVKSPEKPITVPLAEKIAELWGEKRLLYRNNKGQIQLLK